MICEYLCFYYHSLLAFVIIRIIICIAIINDIGYYGYYDHIWIRLMSACLVFSVNKVLLQFQHSLSFLSRGKNIDTKGLHKLSQIFEQYQCVTVVSDAHNWKCVYF